MNACQHPVASKPGESYTLHTPALCKTRPSATFFLWKSHIEKAEVDCIVLTLAISRLTQDDYKILQETQNSCLRKIYGTKTNQSMATIHHLAKLEYVAERVTILQAKFILRSYYMPDDAVFPTLIPCI